jgi:hypothetical protein
VRGLALAPNGDLIVVAGNEISAGSGDPMIGSGHVFRLSPTGVVRPLVLSIDDPFDVAFVGDRCYVANARGVYEVTEK